MCILSQMQHEDNAVISVLRVGKLRHREVSSQGHTAYMRWNWVLNLGGLNSTTVYCFLYLRTCSTKMRERSKKEPGNKIQHRSRTEGILGWRWRGTRGCSSSGRPGIQSVGIGTGRQRARGEHTLPDMLGHIESCLTAGE